MAWMSGLAEKNRELCMHAKTHDVAGAGAARVKPNVFRGVCREPGLRRPAP